MFSEEEKIDMIKIYIRNNNSATASFREYANRFPHRRRPSKRAFVRVYQHFQERKSVKRKVKDTTKTVRTEANEVNILAFFTAFHTASIRDLNREIDISYGSIQRTLKAYHYKDYKYRKVQKLSARHFPLRVSFCRDLFRRIQEDDQFLKKNLWTDECSFSTAGRPNRKNTHFWDTANPHLVKEIQNQGRRSINVWCGIFNHRIIGPIFYEGNLHGERYLNMLHNEISELLDEIPLEEIRDMVWQQDGAPPHNTFQVRAFLNETYRSWIGKNGTIAWPPNSPDLTPLDYFFWGTIKDEIYKYGNLRSLEDIIQKVTAAINDLRTRPLVLENVRLNLVKRLNLCMEKNGGHFEQFL